MRIIAEPHLGKSLALAALVVLAIGAVFSAGAWVSGYIAAKGPCWPVPCMVMDGCLVNWTTGETLPEGTDVYFPGMTGCRCTGGGTAVCEGMEP